MPTTEQTPAKLKILYIAGPGRSGSTLIGNVLSQYERHFHAGELYKVLTIGDFGALRCGCDQPAMECDVWQPILAQVGKASTISSKTSALLNAGAQLRTLIGIPSASMQQTKQEVLNYWQHLIDTIVQQRECRVLIDSSKIPLFAYLSHQLPNVELYVLHLVRDPRGVAYSWARKKAIRQNDSIQQMRRHSSLASAWHWTTRNIGVLLTRRFVSHLVLRYEDFVANPEKSTQGILEFLGEQPTASPFIRSNLVMMQQTHTVHGNPMRFLTNELEINSDDVWQREISLFQNAIVTTVTLPLMLYLGYTP